jgi:hypothetical protein
MEISNRQELSQWVAQQTAYLDPPEGWRPDTAAALTRFHAMHAQRSPWWRKLIWATAALVGLFSLLLLPAGRVVAQQLWQFLTVRQVAFVRVKPWPEGVPHPEVKLIGVPIPPIPARDVDVARQRVNYNPRLPRPGVFSDSPRLSTTFSVSAGTVIHAADLQLALRKAGVKDQTVPANWDGARLALHTSAIVIAEWPDAALVQSLPLTLTAPPDLDFSAFSALLLRVMGVGPDEARRLAQRTGTAPPWLAPIGTNILQDATIEEVQLNSGRATLVSETGRISLTWTVPDRVYLLSGKLSRELAIAAANAVQ